MTRLVPAVLFIALAAIPTVTAQSTRTRQFGRPEATWCSDAGDVDACDVREATLPNLSTIAIDGHPNGGVHVRAWDRSDVHVRVRVTSRARTSAAADEMLREVRLVAEGSRISLDGPRRSGSRDNQWWSGSFEVEVPRKARVTIDVTNGGVVVEGVQGAVDARSTNGGLVFTNVAGDVRGETTNGGVVVDLEGRRWEGSGLDVRTTNGGVRMSLPADYSADLEARTNNGGIRVDFPITMQGFRNPRHELRGTIGSGGPLLRVTTGNGGVQVERK